MSNNLIRFSYYKDLEEAYNSPGFLYADIKSDLRSGDEILKEFGRLKYIPPYYVSNTPASLMSVLADPMYLPEPINKIVFHALPKLQNESELAYYLDIFNSAILKLELRREVSGKSTPPYAAGLRVFFPEEIKTQIENLFNTHPLTDIKSWVYESQDRKNDILGEMQKDISEEEMVKLNEWRREVGLPKR